MYCRDFTCIYLRPLIIASQWESRGEAGGSTWEFKLLFQPHEMAAKYHNAFCIHLLFAFSLGPLCSVITLVHYNGISATERSTSNSTQFVQQTNAINKQMLCKANEDRWIQKRTHVDIRIQTIVILIVLLCWYPFCHISQQQPVQCMEKHHQLSACLFVQRFAAKKQYNDVKAVMITCNIFPFLER